MSWNKITLYKFQQVTAINEKTDMPELDKLLFSICAVFDMTEYQLNNAGIKKAGKLSKKIEKIFSTPPAMKVNKRIGRYLLNYDPAGMTFGQYIELCFYLSGNAVQNIHLVLASISRTWCLKHRTADHRNKSAYFLRQPIERLLGSFTAFVESFRAFNNENKGLFGLDQETQGDVQGDFFNRRYGWIYAASQVAEYERITLDAAYGLPVRQAFNDLAYLKAKSKYELEQIKRK